jgi:N-acetylmuramoyl-L-alanine amidase
LSVIRIVGANSRIWPEKINFAQNFAMYIKNQSYHLVRIFLLFTLIFIFVNANAGDFKVIIDAGHGGKDPGAIGSFSKEKDINLSIALQVGEMIKTRNPNVKIVYTRDGDYFVELQERANIANRSKAQLFISIHTNSSTNSTSYGAETYTMGLRRSNENLAVARRENAVILLEDNYKVKYEGFDPNSSESYIMFETLHDRFMDQSISMATNVQKEFRGNDITDRGVRQDVFLVLRNTGMPSVLVEVGYISNRNDESFLNSKSGQQKVANAIYNAFVQFKRNYDKRQGTLSIDQHPQITEKKDTAERESTRVVTAKNQNLEDVIYKVQILASPFQIKVNSSEFKGEKNIDFYKEKGLYKYTIGNTSDFKEINLLRSELSRKFKDCFVIGYRNGEKFIVK